MAAAVGYDNIGTFEFLVSSDSLSPTSSFAFIEANPRLQVEHTVTEEVYGVDLVAIQLELAAGRSLADLRLLQADVPAPRGTAVQARINLETMQPDGSSRPFRRHAERLHPCQWTRHPGRHLSATPATRPAGGFATRCSPSSSPATGRGISSAPSAGCSAPWRSSTWPARR